MNLIEVLELGKMNGMETVIEAMYFIMTDRSEDDFKSAMLEWELFKSYPLFNFSAASSIKEVLEWIYNEDKKKCKALYTFNIGDEVISVYGEKGRVVDICKCEECTRRGFFEPAIKFENGDSDYITDYEAETGFDGYYSIGKYRFNDFDKKWVIESIDTHKKILSELEAQLKFIEEFEEDKQ